MIVSKRVNYTGRVQGVGFRYTALEVARGYKVDGTVRNCSDGSVALQVQGEPGQVEQFLAAIGTRMADYIANHTQENIEPMAVTGFHIIR
jgi:acylphosphatase